MKKLLFLLIILIVGSSILQAQKKAFIRVYDQSGNKFAKGFLAGTTDSSILIFKDTTAVQIPVSDIGYIKTKRTAGHTIFISSLLAAAGGGVIGAVSGEPNVNDNTLGGVLHDAVAFTPAEGFAAGFIVGAAIGAGTGAIIHAAGKHHTFNINGDVESFRRQRQAIDGLLNNQPGEVCNFAASMLKFITFISASGYAIMKLQTSLVHGLNIFSL